MFRNKKAKFVWTHCNLWMDNYCIAWLIETCLESKNSVRFPILQIGLYISLIIKKLVCNSSEFEIDSLRFIYVSITEDSNGKKYIF